MAQNNWMQHRTWMLHVCSRVIDGHPVCIYTRFVLQPCIADVYMIVPNSSTPDWFVAAFESTPFVSLHMLYGHASTHEAVQV